MQNIIHIMNILFFFYIYLLKLVSSKNSYSPKIKNEKIYPSVLSLKNGGLGLVQTDGIHFFNSNKEEIFSKKINFDVPILSQTENEKISMSQITEEEQGYILIIVRNIIYFFQEDYVLIEKIKLDEITDAENIRIIPYKVKNELLFYIISYYDKNKKNLFGFNFYQFNLADKTNLLIKTKNIYSIKNNNGFKLIEIFGESCLFMMNTLSNEDILSCFFVFGYPHEIKAKTFALKDKLIEEENNYKFFLGNNEIKNLNIISAIPNQEKNESIIYYSINNNLYSIKFNFLKGFHDSNILSSPNIKLTEDFWQKESMKTHESKESIFSSRLYLAYCKSYLIFFNSNFTKFNTEFISHDNKCASLLYYSKFFLENNFSLTIEQTPNNKILITKRRKLSTTNNVVTVPEKCLQTPNTGYTEESITFDLCLKCDNSKGYYQVLDPKNVLYNHEKDFVQCYNEDTKKNFYLDTTGTVYIYKPCYETCASCDEYGNVYDHKCKECDLKYKFSEDEKICEAQCSFADYYLKFFGYYQCTRTNSCPEEAPYLLDTPELKRCYEDCSKTDNHKWSYAGKCYRDCTEAQADVDEDKKTCKDPPLPQGQRCYVTYNSINSKDFMTSNGVSSYAQTYAKDFENTITHVSYYTNSEAIMVIYKDPSCITEQRLQVPKIDYTECKEKIIRNLTIEKNGFNENEDLIIALVGGIYSSSGIETTYSFFYKNGEYINAKEICDGIDIEVTNKIDLSKVDDEEENLMAQGINIFDLNDPFYNDICFMYDSPNGRDATPNDRVQTYFPNVSLCDKESGCVPKAVNLTSGEIICKCEFNDIMSKTKVGEKILEESFGEIYEMIESSNIIIFKCAKDVFVIKHLIKNTGTYISLGILLGQALCVLLYYFLSYNSMLRYLYYLCEYQCSVIDDKILNKENKRKSKMQDNNIIINSKLIEPNAPPRKDEKHGTKTPSVQKLIINEDRKSLKKIDITNSKINLNNVITKSKREKDFLKNEKKTEKKMQYTEKLKDEYDLDIEEYLKTDFDDMEFEDALKNDNRTFCEYYCDRFKETQIIMDTFFNPETLKPMTIKIIIFLLNIIIYFFLSGLFFSEDYVSELFNSDKEEKFFTFFPRSIPRFIYTIIASAIIGIIVDFIAVDEKKVKRLFLREKKNTLQIRYEISVITKDIKRNYLILMIICLAIDLLVFYYANCFNNVYPNLQKEWIKSSVFIMIFMQLLSMLTGLIVALIRLIAFKCKSERIYKIKDFFD